MKYLILLPVLLLGCGITSGPKKLLDVLDFEAPQYVSHVFLDAKTLQIVYSEAVQLTPTILFEPALNAESQVQDHKVSIVFNTKPQAGTQYTMSIEVTDTHGNRNRLHIPFYGINENLPELLISEFTPEGSKNNPDLIELFVTKAGTMTGIALYTAHPEENEMIYIFPEIAVAENDFILVHTKPFGTEEEETETIEKNTSGGKAAHENAWDVWVPDAPGLSNTSGAILLTEYPRGAIMDAVVYTVKQYDEGHRYLGYGKKADLSLLKYVITQGEWATGHDTIGPHGAVNSDPSTSTRSINRKLNNEQLFVDTNSADDWYIVPTRKSSFGEFNIQEVYIP